MVIFGMRTFNIKELIKTAFPLITENRWFVKAYIIYFLLVPFLNAGLISMNRKAHRVLLILTSILFCIWPSFFPCPPLDNYGYSFTHFIFLYVVITYIRLYITELPSKWMCLGGWLVSSVAIVFFSFAGFSTAWGYNFLFVLTASICLFLLFVQADFKSKFVNKLASCAFGIFLIHTDGFFSKLVYGNLFRANDCVGGRTGSLVLSFFVCVLSFYAIGWTLEYFRKLVFRVSVDKIVDRIWILNYEIEGMTGERKQGKLL